ANQNVNDLKVKELRSDNGTDFKNHKIEEFCDEKGISQNFSSPCTLEQNADDGFFLGYSPVAKAFRVFNIRRQEMEETYHVTFSEDDCTICQTNTEETPKTSADPILDSTNDDNDSEVVEDIGDAEQQDQIISESNKPHLNQLPSNEALTNPPVPRDIWPREKHIELVNIIGEPKTGVTTRSRIIEALAEEGWLIAMQKELNQFEKNKFWTLVPRPYGKSVIKTKWIWKNKTDHMGIVIKNKESLVAQGFNQQEGIDYDETFSPVARLEAIRIFLAYAVYIGFRVYQIDVKSAFLNRKIVEEVYVEQPPGFESNEYPDYVYKLDKALYGLKQASRAWYETLSIFLIQHKFVRGTIDNTLFTYKTKSDVIIVQIYVDDIIFGSTSDKISKQFAKLMTKKYEMSMMGELTYFLGFQVKQDSKGISICQEKYVKDLLKKYDLADCASMKCPMLPPNNLGHDESGVSVNENLFRGMIGYQANPKESHLVVVKRIFRYLKATPSLGLWYPKGSGFDLKAYSNSDYAGCNLDRKSSSGGCQILGGKLVCWSSKKQNSMAMSSAEAEYVNASGCYAQVLGIKS
nr:retrovirus-related Pol polyprotein from transposon TNT 1-94 [Tanacetum cinerariifolium]